MTRRSACFFFFFFNDTATTEIYTLSLHDALPIYLQERRRHPGAARLRARDVPRDDDRSGLRAQRPRRSERDRYDRDADRKSTRLNSSHLVISYAVFCLKKKKNNSTYRSLHSLIHV